MRRLSGEDIKYLKYQIYSHRYNDPWIPDKKVAKLIGRSISTVNRYARQAEEEGVIWNPQPRLNPYPDKRVALLLFEDKNRAFCELENHPVISYVCMYQGSWDIMAIYNKPLDFTKIPGYTKTILDGVRGLLFTPKVSFISWEDSFKKMGNLLKKGGEIQESRFDCEPCYPDWDDEDWKMFSYFKFDLRKDFNKLRKECRISWRKYEEWKKNLRKYCTILMSYYPGGYRTYSSITLCMRTSYENYVADVFSCLPTTPVFYRVGEYLFVNIFIPEDYDKHCRILETISALREYGIITHCSDAHGIVHERKDY